jgi:hypothetical protein
MSTPLLEDLELRMMDLEQRLRPIADRPVDITKPGWAASLTASRHPLDRAGVRLDAERLLQELMEAYRRSGDEERQAIRALFAEHRAFAWAASWSFGPTDEEKLRQHLLLFAMKDQGRDSRDALLGLQHLCGEARKAGVDTGAVLREVAALASDTNKYGMGSTRHMLLRASAA